MDDLSGLVYTPAQGKHKGQRIMIDGPDYLFPGEDKWLVGVFPYGKQWSVRGDELRRMKLRRLSAVHYGCGGEDWSRGFFRLLCDQCGNEIHAVKLVERDLD